MRKSTVVYGLVLLAIAVLLSLGIWLYTPQTLHILKPPPPVLTPHICLTAAALTPTGLVSSEQTCIIHTGKMCDPCQ